MLMLYIRVTTIMFQTIRSDDADNLKLSDELAWLIYCLIYRYNCQFDSLMISVIWHPLLLILFNMRQKQIFEQHFTYFLILYLFGAQSQTQIRSNVIMDLWICLIWKRQKIIID